MVNVCIRQGRVGPVRAAVFGMVGLAALVGSHRADAVEIGTATQSVGAWDLKLDTGQRQCRVTLRAVAAGSGYDLAMPAGCRRAFPVLDKVALWNDGSEGRLQFEDAGGQPVLAFEPGAGGVLTGTSPEGEIIRLEPVGQHRATILKVAAKAAGAAPKAAAKPPVPKLPLPSTADMAGHYAVLREKTKDTGCMVTFDDKAHGPKGSLKAHLAPACRDQGIVIFDPVGWQVQGGRLVLTARKGHTTRLDLQEDGSWMKDATEGKSLSLKKM